MSSFWIGFRLQKYLGGFLIKILDGRENEKGVKIIKGERNIQYAFHFILGPRFYDGLGAFFLCRLMFRSQGMMRGSSWGSFIWLKVCCSRYYERAGSSKAFFLSFLPQGSGVATRGYSVAFSRCHLLSGIRAGSSIYHLFQFIPGSKSSHQFPSQWVYWNVWK